VLFPETFSGAQRVIDHAVNERTAQIAAMFVKPPTVTLELYSYSRTVLQRGDVPAPVELE